MLDSVNKVKESKTVMFDIEHNLLVEWSFTGNLKVRTRALFVNQKK